MPTEFFGGTITALPASHGGCVMSKLMGPGAGYLIRLPGEPSLYLTGDTILTDEVRGVLARERPDVCVLPCGSAQLDFGGPILMPIDEILEFVRLAPGRVVANHLECLNHCPTTRAGLLNSFGGAGLSERVLAPPDGGSVEFTQDHFR
jgi:L-ascorbate metabolism protein UlaG (beta-lactamase superfamily)